MKPTRHLALVFSALAVAALPNAASAQKVKVQFQVSHERLERILKELDVSYQKTPNPALFGGGFSYFYTRNNTKIRLTNTNGLHLLIDSVFMKIPLEDVNRWNREGHMSRAVVLSNDALSLETWLVCGGGVTDGMIRQFFRTFESDLQAFSKFWDALELEEEEFQAASAERLEKILRDLKLTFKKKDEKGNVQFEFDKDNYKFRLRCRDAGAVLVLETTFPKFPLDKLNKYNVDRRLVRVVLRQDETGKEFTTLESYLDCRGGKTESIVRYFVSVFEHETRDFDRTFTQVRREREEKIECYLRRSCALETAN